MNFLYKEEPSEKSAMGNLKDCHFKDCSSMESDQCNDYLISFKNQMLKVHKLSEDEEVKYEDIYNMVL